MAEHIENIFINWGLPGLYAEALSWVALAIAVMVVAWLANFVTRTILLKTVEFVIRRSRVKWDDALLEHRVFSRLSHLVPALIIYATAGWFGPAQVFLERISIVYMALTGMLVFSAFLNAIVDVYRAHESAQRRPIKGYVQVIKIIAAVIVGILSVATLLGQKPGFLLGGLGAMTAVIILVFKDTILGLVASVQLSNNDMVRIGDWIEMPKYNADGDVIDITLHTVKVQNWDKTISTIPAYALISDSFKNWRGMSESGGRRIKRSLNIDMNSVKFCDEAMLDRFEKYHLITDYVKNRRLEVERYNRENKVDTDCLINGRRLTNLGTLRAYVSAYLKNHPLIHDDMTFLIRHLQPGPTGLPLEIYVFSKDQVWANYEALMADIFDHLVAAVPLFDLRLYQSPSGFDMENIGNRLGSLLKENNQMPKAH